MIKMELIFLGAVGTVTGSKYLLQINEKKVLIDCGLYQGYKELRLRNWGKLPVSPSEIDAVILTHAHIDHSGYLPLLVKNGFNGPIYATAATRDLCAILLPDSGHLQEEEALYANLHAYSKHKPALPLYTAEDGQRVLRQFVILELHKFYHLFNDCKIRLERAGHILGSAVIQVFNGDKSILFSGDLGRPFDPIILAPTKIKETDYLVIESTYGDEVHDTKSPLEQLNQIINKTIKRGGVIIVPAFAVERAQTLLYYIYMLKKSNKIPDVPVYLDSPLSINATKIFRDHIEEHRIAKDIANQMCTIATYTNTTDESKEIDKYQEPMIIISASGMATGGRILHHLKKFAPDGRNTIILTGFQAPGTRGERIAKGETEVKMLGELVPINAQVESMTNLSAHADSEEILQWLENFTHPPKKVFITHGEPNAAASLKVKIEQKFGWTCVIP